MKQKEGLHSLGNPSFCCEINHHKMIGLILHEFKISEIFQYLTNCYPIWLKDFYPTDMDNNDN